MIATNEKSYPCKCTCGFVAVMNLALTRPGNGIANCSNLQLLPLELRLHSLGAYRHILDAAPANAPAGPYGSIDSSGSEELCPQEWTGHQDVISQNDEIRSEDLVATPKRSLPPTESDNLQSIKRQHVDPQDPQSQEPSAVLKIFKCFLDPFCEMRFTRAEHLARHERQHKSSVHKYALEENRQTELLLVQVHKGMQRENHKRKLAIVAAQKKQQSESAPASKPRATASKSKPSPKTSRVQGAYSPVRSTQGRTFCSDLSHATPIASIRYPEYPPTSCFSPYLHEINHSGSGYASSSGVPYSFQDHLSSIGFSPAYNESPRTPHLSSNFPMHSSPDFEVDRVPSYADLPISSTVNTIPEVAREPYSHIMMEPFAVPSDSDLLSSRQLIPMQPFQPSRKANTSSMFPNPCQLDTESYSQLSNLTSQNVGIPSVCTTEQNSWPPFSFSHPRISLGPSYLTGSHFAPNENMDQSAFREYCHSEASLMQPEPWNEHSTSYLASTPYDGFSKGLEESAHPRMEISHINPSASTHDEHADNLEVFFK
ncbi:uncharacterized protein MELLADRAFT_106555 [Melampsora larici-populina 98AG31]|uniref:C2H2-type domain-containing protein n=1 Tax=Melampsora larici-populina (strain 98AG31 / pathotype 3-4-7) TaxID=747676 RepID=F4RLW0_MELLP|nr:uncharacterized protein MELLADRAFT_106555 [Melampsora larici-populina 98AG31]EGG06611.1 hypothetical protein MELLADRAFT_106555 [Melampsora larici-populina 98AG31]